MRIIASITLALSFFCGSFLSVAQHSEVPVPAPPQSQAIMLTGATVHIGNGEVIKNGVLGFKDGKITVVADAATVKINPEGAKVLNVEGKYIYPGLIALNTTLGLSEVGAVRATRDYGETGSLNPNVRSLIAYNTDSRVIPTIRSNGVLMAQIVPQNGRVRGLSSVVQLDAWNWEDAVIKADDAVHLAWPNVYNHSGWWVEPSGSKLNEKYAEQVGEIKSLLTEGKAWCAAKSHKTENLKLAAMCHLFTASQPLFIHANSIKQIIDAVELGKEFGIKTVIVGAAEAHLAIDFLKANDVAVVLEKTNRLPSHTDDDIDLPFKMPKILHDADILYAITIGAGWDGFWDQRNLAFHAGTAAANGLTPEEALMSITQNAAKILGIAETAGTLEVGKDATLVVSEGDLLDPMHHYVSHAFIQGRQIDLDNKQKALYRKFMGKYGLEPERE